ncbi:MAG: endo-1,4-beta-xylanase [Clostridia bacterium]|nr:endo-1,4-beta-xylanase [Clostridia bacterium]
MSERRKVLELFEEQKDYYEDRVKNGIENNRKGWCEFEIYDEKNRKNCGNLHITVKQKNHEFKYGANLFMLDEFENEEKNEKYKKYFAEAFNMATLPFYWSDLEPERGKARYDKNSPKVYRRPAPDLCIEYCKKNGIEPREHALAYCSFFPSWIDADNSESIKRDLEKRYKEIAERYADKIPTIEVTNETWWDSYLNALYNENDFVEYCFKLAEKYFPKNMLGINEWAGIWEEQGRNRDKYYMQIERALKNGARIDAVGMQYHMFFRSEDEYNATRKFYNPSHLYKILDRYSDFGLPIEITEITIPAYSDSEEDEQIQAEIIKKLYSLWFSHENVEHIIYWNLVDGYAAFAPQGDMQSGENYYRGGLFRFDFTPKPAYYVIKDLFEKEWRTNTEIVSYKNGIGRFKGFYGEYELEFEYDGKKYTKTFNFSKHGNNKFKIIL